MEETNISDENVKKDGSFPKEKNEKRMSKATWGAMLVVLLAVVFYYAAKRKPELIPDKVTGVNETQESGTPAETITPISYGSYKDGTYSVTGDYTSPGGAESIEVKLTLKDNVVTDANVVSDATRPMSIKFQGKFIDGYKQFVIGKNIDELNLDKVSGSSLTPKGFNDAVSKIKEEAKV